MRRIAVVGSGGARKTTFARELGRRTGIAVVNLDEFYWRPGWRRPDRESTLVLRLGFPVIGVADMDRAVNFWT
ncbi:P-loop NTPase family protein [Actinopolyspora lacussalsi]|nr:hypothetical protein [Actinopolyspora righensis]